MGHELGEEHVERTKGLLLFPQLGLRDLVTATTQKGGGAERCERVREILWVY